MDEDWEIHLYDQDKDDAWEVDSSQNKRYYVGSCGFEKLDPVTGRRTSLRIFCGRIRMLMLSPRFQANPRVQSPIRWDSPMESDPSEDAEPVPSESVDSPPTREHVAEDKEEEEVEMTEADMERNADLFLEEIRDEDGMLKPEFIEQAKKKMLKFLEKKRQRSV